MHTCVGKQAGCATTTTTCMVTLCSVHITSWSSCGVEVNNRCGSCKCFCVLMCVCVCVHVSMQTTCWSSCGTGTRSGPAPRCLRDTHTTSCRSSSTPRTTTSLPLHPWTEASRWAVSEEWWQIMIWRPQKKVWNLCWFFWPCLSFEMKYFVWYHFLEEEGAGGTGWFCSFV